MSTRQVRSTTGLGSITEAARNIGVYGAVAATTTTGMKIGGNIPGPAPVKAVGIAGGG